MLVLNKRRPVPFAGAIGPASWSYYNNVLARPEVQLLPDCFLSPSSPLCRLPLLCYLSRNGHGLVEASLGPPCMIRATR